MDLSSFRASIAKEQPPETLPPLLQALWWDAKGDWTRAHEIVQDLRGEDPAWVHAYLHRVEGDLANAGYWYRRAGRPSQTGTLEAEWSAITTALLGKT